MSQLLSYSGYNSASFRERDELANRIKIENICQTNQISQKIKDDIYLLYNKVKEFRDENIRHIIFRGATKQGLFCAVLYLAHRINDIKITIDEISKMTGVDNDVVSYGLDSYYYYDKIKKYHRN